MPSVAKRLEYVSMITNNEKSLHLVFISYATGMSDKSVLILNVRIFHCFCIYEMYWRMEIILKCD